MPRWPRYPEPRVEGEMNRSTLIEFVLLTGAVIAAPPTEAE